ncbi:hypothetical protein ACUNF7_10915 [Serratia sp. IR-2025]
MANVDFKIQLNRQLSFIERSCGLYDSGYFDESIRIATNIRILAHQTKNSTSLLKHLNATTINILNTSMEFKGDVNSTSRFHAGMTKYQTTPEGPFTFSASFDDSPFKTFIPFSKWWTQPILILKKGEWYSRRKIVLAAANKDGGAHVDCEIPGDYELLSSPGIMGVLGFAGPNGYESEEVKNAHYTIIRQMAYELLNSPQLVDLAFEEGD